MPTTYAPNWKEVPCLNALGATVNYINATIYVKTFRPQPFVDSLSPLPIINASETTLQDGYVGHAYYALAEYLETFTISILSGALPTGLALDQPDGQSFRIMGTPTTVGDYTTVFLITNVAGGSGSFTFNISVYADPDEGIGGMIGG